METGPVQRGNGAGCCEIVPSRFSIVKSSRQRGGLAAPGVLRGDDAQGGGVLESHNGTCTELLTGGGFGASRRRRMEEDDDGT